MRRNDPRRILCALVFKLLIMASAVFAQAPGTGAVRGTVYDPSGLTIENAKVTVVGESTNSTRTATTNSAGVFTVPLLTPGSYLVTVSSPGFEAKTASAVNVVVSETSAVGARAC